ncbi:hypothetical protein CCR75_008334 [Bremia lactucae]|uniref:Crinkler effector protein N-terminal domain-containing protein n=1 Tax=Bremia lactucae TaxID=4779 RepID=A0A976IGA3_BRELC|nr:hypothetical protein CCR75_008334 [Bremia lactucae]
MVKLFCAIVNAAKAAKSAFSVRVDVSDTIDDLKNEIKKENTNKITCDANELKLFHGKKDEGRGPWITEFEVHSGVVDISGFEALDAAGAPLNIVGLSDEEVCFKVTKELVKAKKIPVHVLVVLPNPLEEDIAWSIKNLPPMDPQIQEEMWRTVVRVSSRNASGTAIILDQTQTHLYLVTNLHLWVDDTFTDYLSADFKTNIKWLLRANPKLKESGRKRKRGETRRKSPRLAAKKAAAGIDKPQVLVEQLEQKSQKLVEVQRFSLDSDACWYSSFDLAIFKIVAPRSNNLIRCEVSLAYVDRMNVYVSKFLLLSKIQLLLHTHAMMPAYLTAGIKFQMTVSFLSAPCFS